jgi:hypothetical protein
MDRARHGKAAKVAGKRTFFGGDKGAKALDAYVRKLEMVISALYSDGLASPDSNPEDLLFQMVRTLCLFKSTYPNWQIAYSFGYTQFIERRTSGLNLVSAVQRLVDVKSLQSGPPPLKPSDFPDGARVGTFVAWCLDNDPIAKLGINDPAAQDLFRQGFRPWPASRPIPSP